jgi:phosphatidylinositol glycan class Z
MLNRPFSNSLETMLLALLLLVTSRRHEYITDLFVGVICALGLFSRFTFVFVALPAMLQFIADKATFRAKRAVFGIGLLGVGFLGTSAGVLCADVKYYKGADQWTSYIAPLNALLYNSKETNLKNHGLHPRWTHALVNMFILYGPLAMIFYLQVVSAKSIQSLFTKKRRAETELAVTQARMTSTCAWTILSGLGFLSLAPHQEPRFLLPLLVPLAILSAPSFKSTWVLVVWVLFNLILLILYAIFHQGGVVPSLLSRVVPDGAPRAVLYYHTYMPPTFSWRKRNEALADECLAENVDPVPGNDYCSTATRGCGSFPIIDLKGSSVDTLTSALSEHIICHNGDHGSRDSNDYVYVLAPPLTTGTVVLGHDCFVGESYSCRHVRSFRPHLTTEDFPPFEGSLISALWSMELCVFEISCN